MFLLFLSFTNPGYIEPLFSSALGLIMLVGATFWLCVGIFWMSRLVKVEI